MHPWTLVPSLRGIRHLVPALLVLSLTAIPMDGGAQGPDEWRAQGTSRERVADVPADSRLAALVRDLRGGGFVLFCRHGHTDRIRGDTGPARDQQRLLSARGERESREMGAAFRTLGIPVGEVHASPLFRARDTAELAFGDVMIEDALRLRRGGDRLNALLTSAPAPGTNRVLMSHQWLIRPVSGIGSQGRLDEGDCLIFEPDPAAGATELVARMGARDWAP